MKRTRANTALSRVIELLQAGPKTNTELAQILLDEDLTKSNTLTKAKNFVSVMIYNIEKSGEHNVIRVKRGTYKID